MHVELSSRPFSTNDTCRACRRIASEFFFFFFFFFLVRARLIKTVLLHCFVFKLSSWQNFLLSASGDFAWLIANTRIFFVWHGLSQRESQLLRSDVSLHVAHLAMHCISRDDLAEHSLVVIDL